MFFAVYVGSSMDPTLREPEIIEVIPYDNRLQQVGDVAFFLSPESELPIVHRIIQVTRAGISTLGDNNTRKDAFLLQPKNIKGQVVAAWRGQKRRKIAGGLQGKLVACWLSWQHALDHCISPLLHPLYRALANRDLLAWLLSPLFRPQIIIFNTRGQNQFQLLLGQRVIGHYDDLRHQWRIQRPFRLLVNERTLSRLQERTRLDQQNNIKWQRS